MGFMLNLQKKCVLYNFHNYLCIFLIGGDDQLKIKSFLEGFRLIFLIHNLPIIFIFI